MSLAAATFYAPTAVRLVRKRFSVRKSGKRYEDGNLETGGGLLKERQRPAFLIFETLK
jgi:hypothetical protein